MSRFRVTDADGHVTERIEQLAPYLSGRQQRRGYWPGRDVSYPADAWDRSMGKWGQDASVKAEHKTKDQERNVY